MITLEKLAPFLAHNLKSVDWFDGKMLIRDVNLSNAINFVEGYTKAKILCRPFSDLTKPIKVEGYNEGKEFVPIEVLNQYDQGGIGVEYESSYNTITLFACDGWDCISMEQAHEAFQLLYRWHFAVNLEEDDYIDINTI